MRMQPRQQLLEIWRATARLSFQDGRWVWGGRDGSNSISDAEQLLCLLLPAISIRSFVLDRPDEIAEDVLDALHVLGKAIDIPRLLVRVQTEYLRRHADDAGTPSFAGDNYFTTPNGGPPEPEQAALDVVESFAVSLTLTLAAIGFARVFRNELTRSELVVEVDELEELASTRLTAAMVSLLRSFTVAAYDANSAEGRTLIATVSQSGLPNAQVIEDLRRELRDVRAALREVTLGFDTGMVKDLDDPDRLFECGWSWGVVREAPPVPTTEEIGQQPAGVAEPFPYLYFSAVALDGIAELFSERVRILGLLNEEQQRLASALQLRWQITQWYWSTIASFGPARWPLEDIPWRTTDRHESDYFSLLVTAMTVQDLIRRRRPDEELNRVGRVLEELAARARITRRPFKGDPAVGLHVPGVTIDLNAGDDIGPTPLAWRCTDFSPLLLKRTIRLAGLISDTELRGQLLGQADAVWDHLLLRRIKDGPAHDLWDQAADVYAQVSVRSDQPSWHYTERVIECVVAAASVLSEATLRSNRLASFARELLNEAEQVFDLELLGGSAMAGPAVREVLGRVRAMLVRARKILDERPGTAASLAVAVLEDLDQLAAARSELS